MQQRMRPNLSELVACAANAVFGLTALVIALGYELGSVRRMGPGFFPVAVCVTVMALAVATAIESLGAPVERSSTAWRPLLFISLAVIVWTQLIDSLGLVPSTVALIVISSLAKPPFRPVSMLLLSTGICIAGYLIFISGLRMPLTLFGR
ncbi:tripartite tricarboxylate transporter TctB family protein [Psychromarinibacter sp. C21-152]|uniref:Tripartite tricarboxylate transporter TctB family protein n=1 Tax=Psychromarinibacter sediminicola TaxID=3033385 RepID=A0AAE3NSD5_9RHOB|nr:tripartite tricarboxylate transporter TctB family protein [Psychromarinibacter sediminicola]MDF0601141.1 tripartite tricarboxylate transporter TctB family protein [Psychromarinibacter sediminicola]